MTTTINASTSAGLVNSADTSGILQLQTASTAALTIDASQNVGIGTTSPLAILDVASSSNPSVRIRNTSTGGAGIWFANSTSGTTTGDGSNVGIDSNQQLNLWNYENTATLFATNNTERMRVNAGAPILCLAGGSTTATGTGIAFPATQSASSDANTLDDYEEGTWTPAITFGGGSTGLTYASQKGNYTKVGNRVCISGYVAMSNKGSSTGEIAIVGLPFASQSVTDMYNCTAIWAATLTSVSGSLEAYNRPNTAYFSVNYLGTGTTANITQANCNNNSDFMINFSYSI